MWSEEKKKLEDFNIYLNITKYIHFIIKLARKTQYNQKSGNRIFKSRSMTIIPIYEFTLGLPHYNSTKWLKLPPKKCS